MGGGASKYNADGQNADVSKQITKLPPPDEPIRPHGKKMVIKKGCDCGWCEAVSWDVVGELRDTIEKLQQSLMMREVDRAELEALLQVKIEVSTELREKLRSATEDIQDLRKQIHEQQEKIAELDLRLQLNDQPTERTKLEVEELVQWKAKVLDALAGSTDGTLPIDDASIIAQRLSDYEMVQAHCDDANAQVVDLSAELGTLKQTFTHAETNQPVSGLELPSPVPPWKTDLSNTGVCIDRTRLIAASVRLQLENAHQETKRLKRLFAPKKKFAIDTTAPTNGLPQFPIGRDPVFGSPSNQLEDAPSAQGTSPESSPTKDSVEGSEEDEAAKAAELEEKRRKKDEELRAKDPVAYETRKRLEARLSIDSRLAGV